MCPISRCGPIHRREWIEAANSIVADCKESEGPNVKSCEPGAAGWRQSRRIHLGRARAPPRRRSSAFRGHYWNSVSNRLWISTPNIFDHLIRGSRIVCFPRSGRTRRTGFIFSDSRLRRQCGSGRAPAPPANEAGKGRQRQGAPCLKHSKPRLR